MATRKHNDFLDADHSDDEGSQSQGYDSEVEDLKKGRRSPKRRKVESDDDASDNEEDLQDIDGTTKDEEIKEPEQSIDEKPKSKRLRKAEDLPGVSKPLLKKNLVDTDKKIKRSGVVYISRIPPFMKPSKLRSLLSPYGTINRIFMTPEDPASHSKRVRSGGNKKRMFSDGWAEFTNKADAKNACELLNARIIGGKKGTYYHDDVWNLKYLKNFKWNSLTEQIAAENAERTSRMRAEISRTTKENKEFVQNVERAKMLEGMQSKESTKRKKDGEDDEDKGGVEDERFAVPVPKKQKRGGERAKVFGQNKVVKKKKPVEKAAQSEQVKRVLSQIF